MSSSYCKGLNALTDANVAIFYSNGFSYNQRVQAEGRSRRLTSSQSNSIYYDIITKGGADETVYHQLMDKKSVSLTIQFLVNQYKKEGGKYATTLFNYLL